MQNIRSCYFSVLDIIHHSQERRSLKAKVRKSVVHIGVIGDKFILPLQKIRDQLPLVSDAVPVAIVLQEATFSNSFLQISFLSPCTPCFTICKTYETGLIPYTFLFAGVIPII